MALEKTQEEQAAVDRILKLRHLLAMQFLEEHWATLGELTGCSEVIREHEKLGQVHWGDNAYDACVLKVLMTMVERCPEALPVIERYAREICDGCDEDALANATLTRL